MWEGGAKAQGAVAPAAQEYPANQSNFKIKMHKSNHLKDVFARARVRAS